MIIKATSSIMGQQGGTPLSLRCPNCRQIGTFQNMPHSADVTLGGSKVVGQRLCPNPECKAHIFVVLNTPGMSVAATYPALRIDFDSSCVPASIVKALTEAITCHASGCHIASAIMIRKTLELICEDRGADGKTLHERLANLTGKVVLPSALLTGMNNLKLMGNDAAHIVAKTYDTISDREIRVAIEVTKEVLKSLYQLDGIVGQLEALKA